MLEVLREQQQLLKNNGGEVTPPANAVAAGIFSSGA
jgi:hypothetical protein